MPLLNSRLSLTCSAGRTVGPCNTNPTTPPASRLSFAYTARQTRVLRTTTSAAAATARRHKTDGAPRLRSPLQWSSIAHLPREHTLSSFSGSGTIGKMGDSQQVRAHSHSHGHGHHHHHDTTFLTSANRNDPGVKITRVGLYVNLGMAVAKGAGGYLFNSQALTADALHALTDLVSDIMTLATISYSLKPVTSRFPTGYGKIESLGALAVSGLLLSGGIMIGLQALMALSQQFFPEIAHILSHLEVFGHGHSHSHSHDAEHFGPNINAAWLAGGSIIIKEWLYRATMKVANKKRSSVLASNAYHHRVDSLTAFVALLTISASHFISSAAWLDPVGGLVISGMIVQAGWGNTKSALLELADVAMDEEVKENVETAAKQALLAHTTEAVQIRGIQGIKSGQNFLVDIEVGAPSHWTVGNLNAVEDAVRAKIAADVKGVRRVTLRFASGEKEAEPFADEFIKGKADGVEAEHEHEHTHDHDHDHGHSSSAQVNGTANKRK